ncbi:MAG: hypothetical protein ABL864_00755 [Terricaulis sp.]
MITSLLQRWRALAGEGNDDLGEALISAWRAPQRKYHDQGHLTWLLDEADGRAPASKEPRFVGFAIWFHDAIYEPGRSDNEARSAGWARAALADDPILANRVAQVIEMTKNHWEGQALGDAALFLDMDIAILGAARNIYRDYARGVRQEFAQFPDAVYGTGRCTFLDSACARARLFRTDYYESLLASQARANMSWEREELRNGRMVLG